MKFVQWWECAGVDRQTIDLATSRRAAVSWRQWTINNATRRCSLLFSLPFIRCSLVSFKHFRLSNLSSLPLLPSFFCRRRFVFTLPLKSHPHFGLEDPLSILSSFSFVPRGIPCPSPPTLSITPHPDSSLSFHSFHSGSISPFCYCLIPLLG